MTLPLEKNAYSVAETEKLGAELGEYLVSSNMENAFIAMYGDLGAGKTAFVRGIASSVTPSANVCSPTYTVVNEYHGGGRRFCHFDMYRIESEEDLYSIGFFDYDGCMIAAEWCEKIPFALPDSYVRVDITKLGENERKIEIKLI